MEMDRKRLEEGDKGGEGVNISCIKDSIPPQLTWKLSSSKGIILDPPERRDKEYFIKSEKRPIDFFAISTNAFVISSKQFGQYFCSYANNAAHSL
jgi:hypothetical protein